MAQKYATQISMSSGVPEIQQPEPLEIIRKRQEEAEALQAALDARTADEVAADVAKQDEREKAIVARILRQAKAQARGFVQGEEYIFSVAPAEGTEHRKFCVSDDRALDWITRYLKRTLVWPSWQPDAELKQEGIDWGQHGNQGGEILAWMRHIEYCMGPNIISQNDMLKRLQELSEWRKRSNDDELEDERSLKRIHLQNGTTTQPEVSGRMGLYVPSNFMPGVDVPVGYDGEENLEQLANNMEKEESNERSRQKKFIEEQARLRGVSPGQIVSVPERERILGSGTQDAPLSVSDHDSNHNDELVTASEDASDDSSATDNALEAKMLGEGVISQSSSDADSDASHLLDFDEEEDRPPETPTNITDNKNGKATNGISIDLTQDTSSSSDQSDDES